MEVGQHLLFDLRVENTTILRDAKELEVRFQRVFAEHSVSVLDFISHSFQGQGGVTGVFLLAESHARFHTWPEHALLCCDLFACREVNLIEICAILTREFAGKQIRRQIIPRGDDSSGY